MARLLQSESLRSLLENPDLLIPKAAPNKIGKPSLENAGVKKVESQEVFAGQGAFLGANLWDKTFDLDMFTDGIKFDEADLVDLLAIDGLTSSQDSDKQAAPKQAEYGDSDLAELFTTGAIDPNTIFNTPKVEAVEEKQAHSDAPILSLVSGVERKVAARKTSVDRPELGDLTPPNTPPLIEKLTEQVDVRDMITANIPGLQDFDPRKKRFSDEELLPQPIIKKSKRVFVSDNDKDEKYWAKRNKNNVAAQRSREARRVKENQIAVRTAFLEKENSVLKEELEKYIQENESLASRLSKYETV